METHATEKLDASYKMPNNRLHADVQTYALFVVSLRYTLSQKTLRFCRW